MRPRLPGTGLVNLLNLAEAGNENSSAVWKQEFETREEQISISNVDVALKVWRRGGRMAETT